jgi:pimeloyl-ACP methyl ester carboxylesterase
MKTLFLLTALAVVLIYSDANPVKPYKISKNRLIHGRPYGGFVKKPIVDSRTPKSPTYYHDSKVDNFDSINTKTYKQRYWYNEQWYKPGGPQFLMIGGEAAESSYWVDSGNVQWTIIAKEVGAIVFDLEHRFYGESQPTGDLTFESLKYLTSEQALADVKHFIMDMNAKFNFTNPRWITFGGSYPGALSAWARQTYPDIIYAAVASSGPVQAVVDFTGYLDVVYNALNNYDPKCSASVHNGFLKINELIKTEDGRSSLSKSFNTCETIKGDSDTINYFYESIIGTYMGQVQYSGPTTIPNLCQLQTSSSDDLQGVVAVNNMESQGCLDVSYQAYIDFMKDTSVNAEGVEYRAWVWQTCNEFGFYQSTDSSLVTGDFTGADIPVEWYVQQCAQVYDPSMGNTTVYANIKNTNKQYLGQKGYNGTKVVFPNGTNDPWHVLSVLSATNSKTYPVIIDGTSHCADMYGPRSNDPPSLTEGRKKIHSHVVSWVYK